MAQYVRAQLDWLSLGSELHSIQLGPQMTISLPPTQAARALPDRLSSETK